MAAVACHISSGRIDRGRVTAPPFARGAVKLPLEKYAGNLYYDTILHDDAALQFLIERVGFGAGGAGQRLSVSAARC